VRADGFALSADVLAATHAPCSIRVGCHHAQPEKRHHHTKEFLHQHSLSIIGL
jgi:hypothetical protein